MSDALAPDPTAPDPTAPDPGAAEPARHAELAVPREARAYQGRRAGLVTRIIANAIDAGVAFGVVLGLYIGWLAVVFLINPVNFSMPSPRFLAAVLASGAVLVLYFTGSWATSGRTLGDRIMGLRVVNFRGDRMRWGGAFIRAAFCTVFPVGIFWILISPSNRSVQDTVLRTSCIYDWIDRPFGAHPPHEPA